MRAGKQQPKRVWWAVVILLSWLLFAQALGAARAASITFDEGPHLAVGYATLRTGDLRLQPVHIHPPLANVLAAAPLLLDPDLPDPRSIFGWEIASLSAVTDAVVWGYPHPARLALASRLPIILLTLLTGALVFRWAADWGGAKAGLLALGLYTLDPNVIAHGSLVTTDMAVTAFGLLTFFLLHRYRRRPGRARLVGAGLALGLALASKVSALLLLLLVGVVLLLRGRRRAWRQGMQAWLILVLIAFVTLWAIYRFELRPLPWLASSVPPLDRLRTVPLPAATHLEIYRSLQEHYRLGHPTFILGQNSDQGWWFYFPVAFVVKTPLTILILLGAALVIFVRRRHSIDPALILFPSIYPVTALFSSVNIGYRHLLPILPFVHIFVACQVRNTQHASHSATLRGPGTRNTHPTPLRYGDQGHATRITHHVLRFTFYGLILWLAAGTALVQPHPLTYFNELAGGPEGGYRWLVDSNLDWGQNLWQLRDWTQAESVERVYYSHFTPAHPEVYGVTADWLPPDPRAVPFAPLDPIPGVYVIGATTLQGVYTPDVNTFAWFRSRKPLARLGHALFIYQVPPREPPTWVAVCADPVPTLSPEAVRAGFGRPDLRVILMDCEQSWVYPAGGGPGGYVLPPKTEPPSETTLEVQARHPNGKPFYRVYRIEDGGMIPRLDVEGTDGVVYPARDVMVDGPLTFLGAWIDHRSAVHAGKTVELWTFWRVEGVPDRPLSLMGHMVEPNDTPIAVSDGLGVPIEQWQLGDTIVQRHRFQVPQDTGAGFGSIRTGVYWLDTLERWSVHDEQGNVNDQIEVQTIAILH